MSDFMKPMRVPDERGESARASHEADVALAQFERENPDQVLLTMYFDGELDPVKQRDVELRLANDAAFAEEAAIWATLRFGLAELGARERALAEGRTVPDESASKEPPKRSLGEALVRLLSERGGTLLFGIAMLVIGLFAGRRYLGASSDVTLDLYAPQLGDSIGGKPYATVTGEARSLGMKLVLPCGFQLATSEGSFHFVRDSTKNHIMEKDDVIGVRCSGEVTFDRHKIERVVRSIPPESVDVSVERTPYAEARPSTSAGLNLVPGVIPAMIDGARPTQKPEVPR